MRLFAVFLVFLGTIGIMTLQNIHKGSQTASILTITSPTTTNTLVITTTPTKTIVTPIITTPTPVTTTTTPLITPTITPANIITSSPIATTNIPNPQYSTSTQVPSPTTTTGHTFYTSSHWKSKFYYCDTDPDWHTLSATYLKIFHSEQELLAAYPTHILHEPCK